MPDIRHCALFLLSGLLLNMTPGADMLFIVSRSAELGVRAGAMAAPGGLSALIAAYLVWLGIGLLRDKAAAGAGVAGLILFARTALASKR